MLLRSLSVVRTLALVLWKGGEIALHNQMRSQLESYEMCEFTMPLQTRS